CSSTRLCSRSTPPLSRDPADPVPMSGPSESNRPANRGRSKWSISVSLYIIRIVPPLYFCPKGRKPPQAFHHSIYFVDRDIDVVFRSTAPYAETGRAAC